MPPIPLCPICAKPIDAATRPARLAPFCSQRCADIDLGRWFTGQYRVPEAPGSPADDASALDPDPDPG